MNIASILADYLQAKKILSTGATRKLFNSLGKKYGIAIAPIMQSYMRISIFFIVYESVETIIIILIKDSKEKYTICQG